MEEIKEHKRYEDFNHDDLEEHVEWYEKSKARGECEILHYGNLVFWRI